MSNPLARRYAEALYDHANEQNHVEAVVQEIRQIAEIIKKSSEFRRFIKDPTLSFQKREVILKEIFGQKISALTQKFLLLLNSKNRLNVLPHICTAFELHYRQEKGIVQAKIFSRVALKEQQIAGICGRLKEIFKKDIEPQQFIDSKILGGVKVQVEDRVFDDRLEMHLVRFKEEQLAIEK